MNAIFNLLPLGYGKRNAYMYGTGGPIHGPEGRFHLLWVWRETGDHETNHSLSCARTVDNDLWSCDTI
jgi:hypothetical protein